MGLKLAKSSNDSSTSLQERVASLSRYLKELLSHSPIDNSALLLLEAKALAIITLFLSQRVYTFSIPCVICSLQNTESRLKKDGNINMLFLEFSLALNNSKMPLNRGFIKKE